MAKGDKPKAEPKKPNPFAKGKKGVNPFAKGKGGKEAGACPKCKKPMSECKC